MSYNCVSLAGTATIGPKGQVVIPADVREKMQIAPGDKLVALYINDKEAVAFITERAAQAIIDKMSEHINALHETLEE